MNAPTVITLSASLCALVIVSLLIIGAILGGNLKEKVYRWFFAFLMANFFGTCCEIITACLVGKQGQPIATAMQITDLFNYTFGYIIFITFAMYIYEYLSTKTKIPKSPIRFVVVINIVSIILFAAAQFSGLFVLLDSTNNYNPDSPIWLMQIMPVMSMTILVSVTLKNASVLKARESVSIIVYFLVQIFCYIVEGAFPGVWISYLGSAISAFLVYINIQVELKQKIKEQELEMAESRMAMMLSQIQPHFLYNSLAVITQLCDENPARAKKAAIEFSTYLRGNMESLEEKEPVLFEKELCHAEGFLSLEKAMYEEALNVVYDIKVKGFKLPILSLQPIVENAVRHGIGKREGGGTITISTEETDGAYLVVVSDDGMGFNTDKIIDDGQRHIGISNVRTRLKEQSGGSLEITSERGIGTTVTMRIPKPNDIGRTAE